MKSRGVLKSCNRATAITAEEPTEGIGDGKTLPEASWSAVKSALPSTAKRGSLH